MASNSSNGSLAHEVVTVISIYSRRRNALQQWLITHKSILACQFSTTAIMLREALCSPEHPPTLWLLAPLGSLHNLPYKFQDSHNS